jgi:imidazolonepropionase-like amidohydrolase
MKLRHLTAAGLLACARAEAAESTLTAFVGARLVDGKGGAPVENAVLVVRDGRVEAAGPRDLVDVPPGARTIELRGKTIVPGLVNAHGHLADVRGLASGQQYYTEENLTRQLGVYARYGVTSVFSLGGDADAGFRLRAQQAAGPLPRARVFVSGPVITAATPEAARLKVDEIAATKPDILKIRVDDNLGTTAKLPAAVAQAVVDQAHKRGLRVAAHIFYLEDAKALLRAGVDFIAHSVRDRPVDEELVALLKQRGVCLCPTLTRELSTFVYESTPDFFADPFFLREADPAVLEALRDPARQQSVRDSESAQRYKKALEVASANLKRLSDAGVRIAFGTDTGPPARFQGYFEHLELELMAKAGLEPKRILVSATGDAARCLNAAGRIGTLEPGAAADFVVLDRNPLADVRNARAIDSVWIAGVRVPR